MLFLQDGSIALPVLALAFFLLAGSIIYRLFFHPLSHIPGPFLGRVSSWYLYILCYLGIEGHVLRNHHAKYNTKVLRVAPNSVSISDSSAVHPIYIGGGGFQKDARYSNFNLGPVVSIFSARETEYRDARAKAVASLFSPARLRIASQRHGVIKECVSEYIKRLQDVKTLARGKGMKVDLLDLSARLSIDVVSGYLLNERYGGLSENGDLPLAAQLKKTLSANPFIFAIVAFSRFSLLPNRLFKLAYAVSSKFNTRKEVVKSAMLVDNFADMVLRQTVSKEDKEEDSYQQRLLSAGFSRLEVTAQSKAVIFAGTDSTAVMLSTILFHLVQKPAIRTRLLQEIRSGSCDNPEELPYLRAVVKEGLRLGMANPTRATRVVPNQGLTVDSIYIPPNTVVGCAAYTLHHDENIFTHPFEFLPERWLENGKESDSRRTNMERSMFAFGAGLRACIGKGLAQKQLYETIFAVVDSQVLEGARTCQEHIDIIEWFNAEIKGHKLEIEWS